MAQRRGTPVPGAKISSSELLLDLRIRATLAPTPINIISGNPPMNIIRISLATLVLSLGFGLVSCEKKAPEGDAPAPAADAPAADAPAAPAEQPKAN